MVRAAATASWCQLHRHSVHISIAEASVWQTSTTHVAQRRVTAHMLHGCVLHLRNHWSRLWDNLTHARAQATCPIIPLLRNMIVLLHLHALVAQAIILSHLIQELIAA